MTQPAAHRAQRISPYLAYDDAPGAIEFLCKAFGFEERSRHAMPDGRVGHAELVYRDNVLFLASTYQELGFASPLELPAVHSQIHCYVDDVDAHFQQARAAGATITVEPVDEDYGDRIYRAVDPEGHRWIFAQQLRDVALEDTPQ